MCDTASDEFENGVTQTEAGITTSSNRTPKPKPSHSSSPSPTFFLGLSHLKRVISFVDLGKNLGRVLLLGSVWMVLARQLVVFLLDVLVAGIARHAKHLVEIALPLGLLRRSCVEIPPTACVCAVGSSMGGQGR